MTRLRDQVVRRTSAKAKAQAKKDQKTKEKIDKLNKKSEKLFDKALSKFSSTAVESEKQYILRALEDNPAWINPLSNLIRHGALNSLLRMNASGEPIDDTSQWRGKATKITQLPSTVKLTMLKACGIDLPQENVNADWLDKAFQVNFFVADSVPLPKDPNIRNLKVVETYAVQREADLGFSFLNRKQNPPCSEDALQLWSLSGNELTCHVNDDTADLPQLPGGKEWKLTDAHDPECQVVPADSKGPGPFDFSCYTFFEVFGEHKPNLKWPVLEAASP